MNLSIKRHNVVGVLQSKTQLYAASKRPVPAQQKNRRKRKDGKWSSKQMAPKRELCGHTCIRQSRLQKKVMRDKDGHYIMIKGTIHQEDIIRVIHIYALNIDALNQKDWIDLYRTFYPNGEYTFISSAHEVLSRTDHMLGHKTNVNKVKNGMISSIFSEHKSVKLDINYKKKAEKIYKYVKAKQMLQCKN